MRASGGQRCQQRVCHQARLQRIDILVAAKYVDAGVEVGEIVVPVARKLLVTTW